MTNIQYGPAYIEALAEEYAKAVGGIIEPDRPTVIVAHTTKGKGVSFMENDARWHGVPPDDAQFAQAMAELKGGA